MEEWHLSDSDLKRYPHFDPAIPARQAQAFATDKDRVAKYPFYPFIQYIQRWTRFRKKGDKPNLKKRPIRYAARRDAYIFSYYRHILSQRYELELARLGLAQTVLAYRKIPVTNSGGCKCNIHFANDAILKIRELGDCCAIALDISSYFESLDHAQLKKLWCRMLEAEKLPPDHFRVFQAITRYIWVDEKKLYERLGHFGDKPSKNSRTTIRGYLTPYDKMPIHLCNPEEFRRKVAGCGCEKSIVETNYKPYGIPQGAPISDLLANLYLIDFDHTVAGWVREKGGAYYRYSDDILIVAPGLEATGRDLMRRTCELIRSFGPKLEIKEKKTSLILFQKRGVDQTFQLLQGTQGKNGLEYLGFRYDGKKIYLRDATISNLRRKVARAAYRDADACARRYPDKDALKLKSLFNYERLIKQFGRVEDFGEMHSDYRKWTFWTYAKRASKVFGTLGKPILRQLRKHRGLIRWRVDKSLERAVIRRENRKHRSTNVP